MVRIILEEILVLKNIMSNVDGFGAVTWWGFSPALNLTAFCDQGRLKRRPVEAAECTVESDHVNVLLVGSGDLRHVIMTVALASRHTSKPLHFYIIESCLEVFARHMLFLALLLEPPDALGLQEKTELFLELYGNSLIRAHTSVYLKSKATDLIKVITDDEHSKLRLPLLDTSALKFKEKDFLEGIFKFWRNPEERSFDISSHWEGRLRHHLGAHYDSRSGVYDWDYHMKLQEMAPSINQREYSEWRETGLAFQLREDAPYEASNRTLASGLLITQSGEKVARRGYWGDIVNSPYLSFGVQSENKDLFKSKNGKCISSSVDISNYNVTSLIHKLITGEEYWPSKQTSKQPPAAGQRSSRGGRYEQEVIIEEVVMEDTRESKMLSEKGAKVNQDGNDGDTTSHLKGPLCNGGCYVSLLPLGSVSELSRKAKYKNLFNIVYFSNSMVHHLKSGIEETFAPDCTLVIETAKFMLDLSKEQKIQYEKKVKSMAEALGFKVPLVTGDDPALAHLAFTSN